MKKDQREIFYVCAENVDKAKKLPVVEKALDKGYEILYLVDAIDEFVFQILNTHNEKSFINLGSKNFDLDTKEEKEHIEKVNKESKKLFDIMKEALNNSVTNIKFTNNLKSHPVCLTTEGEVSIEMEKVLNAMPTEEKVKANLVLEINENHQIAKKIKDLYNNDQESLKEYTKILYAQARLIEGLNIDDPTELANSICNLLAK